MPFPHALRIFQYWESFPPEHEMLAMLAKCFTTWEPKPLAGQPSTAAQHQAHGAMGPAEFMEHFKRTGGRVAGLSSTVAG